MCVRVIFKRDIAVSTWLSTWTVIRLGVQCSFVKKLCCYKPFAFATLLILQLYLSFLLILGRGSMRFPIHWLAVIALSLILLHLSVLLVDVMYSVLLVLQVLAWGLASRWLRGLILNHGLGSWRIPLRGNSGVDRWRRRISSHGFVGWCTAERYRLLRFALFVFECWADSSCGRIVWDDMAVLVSLRGLDVVFHVHELSCLVS